MLLTRFYVELDDPRGLGIPVFPGAIFEKAKCATTLGSRVQKIPLLSENTTITMQTNMRFTSEQASNTARMERS